MYTFFFFGNLLSNIIICNEICYESSTFTKSISNLFESTRRIMIIMIIYDTFDNSPMKFLHFKINLLSIIEINNIIQY